MIYSPPVSTKIIIGIVLGLTSVSHVLFFFLSETRTTSAQSPFLAWSQQYIYIRSFAEGEANRTQTFPLGRLRGWRILH